MYSGCHTFDCTASSKLFFLQHKCLLPLEQVLPECLLVEDIVILMGRCISDASGDEEEEATTRKYFQCQIPWCLWSCLWITLDFGIRTTRCLQPYFDCLHLMGRHTSTPVTDPEYASVARENREADVLDVMIISIICLVGLRQFCLLEMELLNPFFS